MNFYCNLKSRNFVCGVFYSSLKMTKDFVNTLKELKGPKVHIKNKDTVNQIIKEIIEGGIQQLQVVSDFDQTITKQHENGKVHLSSFGIFALCKSLPQSYLECEQTLKKKYLPIEVDPNIPFIEKKKLMEEWWSLSEQQLKGLVVPTSDIDDIVEELGPSLRDGCINAFVRLNQMDVPVLVFSAGLGDAVVSVLKHYNVLLPNVKVISNFLSRDENGVIQGFQGHMINVFNKNELALEGTEYYDLVKERSNIIVMGDSIGDAAMADGAHKTNAVLKIGFLYDHVIGNLPSYMEHFDIVLEDDQSMDVLNAILNEVLK